MWESSFSLQWVNDISTLVCHFARFGEKGRKWTEELVDEQNDTNRRD